MKPQWLLKVKVAALTGLFVAVAHSDVFGVAINAEFDASVTEAQKTVINKAIDDWVAKLSSKSGKLTISFFFESIAPMTIVPPGMEITLPADPVAQATTGPLGVTSGFGVDGNFKPASAIIRLNSKFTWWEGVDLPPGGVWPDLDMYDMFSVVKHEIGHALGFAKAYKKFAFHISAGPGANRTYNAGGIPTATLTAAADGTHTDATAHPGDLMNPTIGKCTRRLKSALDRDILNHGVWDPNKKIPQKRVARWTRGDKGYVVERYYYINLSQFLFWNAVPPGGIKVPPGAGAVIRRHKSPFPPTHILMCYRWQDEAEKPPARRDWQFVRAGAKGGGMRWRWRCPQPFPTPDPLLPVFSCVEPDGRDTYCLTNLTDADIDADPLLHTCAGGFPDDPGASCATPSTTEPESGTNFIDGAVDCDGTCDTDECRSCCIPDGAGGATCEDDVLPECCRAIGGSVIEAPRTCANAKCQDPKIPTVSAWGLAVLCLLVLAAGTIVMTRRRTAVA